MPRASGSAGPTDPRPPAIAASRSLCNAIALLRRCVHHVEARPLTPFPPPAHAGAFQESGPLWTNAAGNLEENTWTWNNFSSTLYLEAPACVGFSYADNTGTGCSHDDTSAAVDNLAALVQWFTLFPEFQKNDFWITGESYAG